MKIRHFINVPALLRMLEVFLSELYISYGQLPYLTKAKLQKTRKSIIFTIQRFSLNFCLVNSTGRAQESKKMTSGLPHSSQ